MVEKSTQETALYISGLCVQERDSPESADLISEVQKLQYINMQVCFCEYKSCTARYLQHCTQPNESYLEFETLSNCIFSVSKLKLVLLQPL